MRNENASWTLVAMVQGHNMASLHHVDSVLRLQFLIVDLCEEEGEYHYPRLQCCTIATLHQQPKWQRHHRSPPVSPVLSTHEFAFLHVLINALLLFTVTLYIDNYYWKPHLYTRALCFLVRVRHRY